MNWTTVIQGIVDIVGAISIIATTLGAILPKGSKVGGIAAKVGADLKNHTKIMPAPPPASIRGNDGR